MSPGRIKTLIPGHELFRVSLVHFFLCLILPSYSKLFFFFFLNQSSIVYTSLYTKLFFCLSWLDLGWSLVLESILTNLYFRWLSSLAIIKNTGKNLRVDTFSAYVPALIPHKNTFPE